MQLCPGVVIYKAKKAETRRLYFVPRGPWGSLGKIRGPVWLSSTP